jgi:hypothetical protein
LQADGCSRSARGRDDIDICKSALLWLVGIPLPIILLIALYLHPG